MNTWRLSLAAERMRNEINGIWPKRDKKSDGFYFTGIPEFDKKAWEKILENLEGLS